MDGPGGMAARAAHEPFADRLARLVTARRSQICLGLDPDPAALPERIVAAAEGRGRPDTPERRRATAAGAIVEHCRGLIEQVGPSCVAVKLQLACFERLGYPGWQAAERVVEAARGADLLVIADGKRGDVPVTARAYGQALVGEVSTPWGPVPGLGADAFTANPLLGRDAVEPLVEAAAAAAAGVFLLVRTSNAGAHDIQDLPAPRAPLHEHLAELVASYADRLAGQGGLSGAGAVVGATEPERLGRLRELMPRAILLLPGVGAQGGRPEALGVAFVPGPASALVPVSRGIAGAEDPAGAAEELREAVWSASRSGG